MRLKRPETIQSSHTPHAEMDEASRTFWNERQRELKRKRKEPCVTISGSEFMPIIPNNEAWNTPDWLCRGKPSFMRRLFNRVRAWLSEPVTIDPNR